jgi:hypothetical protein
MSRTVILTWKKDGSIENCSAAEVCDHVLWLRNGAERLKAANIALFLKREKLQGKHARATAHVSRLKHEIIFNLKSDVRFGLLKDVVSENEKLRAALRKYGQHRWRCNWTLEDYWSGKSCPCGYYQARKELLP